MTRVGRGALVVVTTSLALLAIPATRASASSTDGPAHCQVAMASPRTVGRSITATVQVTCSSPVDLGLSGALWRARGNGTQKMAAISRTFRHTTTARMSVTLPCPGGTSSWVSTGNSTYTLNGVDYLLGGISARQRLAC